MAAPVSLFAWLFLLPVLLLVGAADPSQPLAEEGDIEPFPGCRITRRTLTEPRPHVVYVVRLDPAAVRFSATGDNGEEPLETTLKTTRAFLEENRLDLAFNGSFYRSPGGVSPYADLCGAAVAGGQVVSQQEPGFPAVEIDGENRLKLLGQNFGISGRHVVVAGSSVLVEKGRRRIAENPSDPAHPRTALGTTADGTLLVVLVDGRQRGVSEGVTQVELADLLVAEGATLAINLDGGGSTTLVIRDKSGKGRVVNRPVGIFNQPGTERPVAFNLGVTAAPPEAEGATKPAGE
jgi:exopolysaccharide biosynthesis protein